MKTLYKKDNENTGRKSLFYCPESKYYNSTVKGQSVYINPDFGRYSTLPSELKGLLAFEQNVFFRITAFYLYRLLTNIFLAFARSFCRISNCA